jgi:hypothetical protein
MRAARRQCRDAERPRLREVNRQEAARLRERWLSDEVFQLAEKFMRRRREKP